MSSFTFVAAVGAAEVAGSSSAVYTVTVRTNLAEYREHGEGPPVPEVHQEAAQGLSGELDDDVLADEFANKLVIIPERTITVKRSYSAFREVSCPRASRCRCAAAPDTCALAAAAFTRSCEKRCAKAAFRGPQTCRSCLASLSLRPLPRSWSCGSAPSPPCSRTSANTRSLQPPTRRAHF